MRILRFGQIKMRYPIPNTNESEKPKSETLNPKQIQMTKNSNKYLKPQIPQMAQILVDE